MTVSIPDIPFVSVQVIDVLHPNRPSVPKEELKEKLAKTYKVCALRRLSTILRVSCCHPLASFRIAFSLYGALKWARAVVWKLRSRERRQEWESERGGSCSSIWIQDTYTNTYEARLYNMERSLEIRVVQDGDKLGNREGDSAARERTASCLQAWSFWCLVLDRSERASACGKHVANMRHASRTVLACAGNGVQA